ncbi:polyhydroxyalkanoate depolymerase [Roseomonas sp. NAR14]|uniref:Polyhydroxyalkanoate depolymerase n=1 Tax=Roseomonas acroporae TaxID=2937791 RepID=A0A9X1Y8N5_9PROT|nr:polyhydroxyalkanoate depolymerase [Roseomonas acroporae]
MIYRLCQTQEDWLSQARAMALGAEKALSRRDDGHSGPMPMVPLAAALRLWESAGTTHDKPAFGIDEVRSDGRPLAVREEVAMATPFGTLLHLGKDTPSPGPRLLVVAPLSGHFATRLRATVATLLRDHDVYVTDWTDAREVPVEAGAFGLDDLVAQIIAFLEALGPDTHLLAVSQPAVATLAAAALMAEDRNPALPRSLTLIGGPVDPRIAPTRDEILSRLLPPEWFERTTVGVVPERFAGAGRRVHPGALQWSGAVLSDLRQHVFAQTAQFANLVTGDAAAADRHRDRYEELRSVMDVPAELYLDMIARTFREPELMLGRMLWRGRPVRMAALRETALLAVEGEGDRSCPAGQCSAALDLCDSLPAGRKRRCLVDAEHDGLFEGAVWETQVYPVIRQFVGSAAA